jgi:hypothetical protein
MNVDRLTSVMKELLKLLHTEYAGVVMHKEYGYRGKFRISISTQSTSLAKER